ncbi:MAG: L,D-transpeptidase [Anaerolineae bacterium]|nr:L,D-transpeptidase [Anaerolineae bacterium]
MPYTLNRRQMLKLIIAAATAATMAPSLHARAHYPTQGTPEPDEETAISAAVRERVQQPWVWMGRAIHTVTFYDTPSTSGARLDTRYRDQAFRILGETRAPFSAHNDLWYETELGYVHSAWVLPLRIYPPQPFLSDIGTWGFWGEVSQVYTAGRTAPSANAAQKYRFYGGHVFHVIDAQVDEEGIGWYKVFDDYPPKQFTNHQWILAKDVRQIPREEMAPIHPFAGEKHIIVDLPGQRLTCYEGEEPVFSTLVASGLPGVHATPTGERCVLLKQASRHMANVPYEGMPDDLQPDPSDIFDLPGIPWNTFFDLEGRAIHGAYWHNDFGVQRSHGCLNVACEAARWVYRWVHPVGGYEDEFIQSDCTVGTPITFL